MKALCKRLVSLLLVLSMMITMVPAAFAQEGQQSSGAVSPISGNVQRIAGADRIGTSLGIADQMKQALGGGKFDTVVVASALNFPDALTGSYLAAVKSAPILLTYEAANGQIQGYIEENLKENGTVYILGGSTAVSTGFETSLKNLGRFTVKRLAGTDRFGTNLKIMEEAGAYGNTDQPILIATALNFADSLSASATGLPMVLVHGSLKPEQKAFLETTSKNFVIIGGTSAVSESLEAELRAIGNSVERLAGAGRYQTSVMVAQKFFGSTPGSAVLAYARNFPDGLCAGPLANKLGAPLILTDNYDPREADEYVVGINRGFVVGGAGLISDVATRAIFDLGSSTPGEDPVDYYTVTFNSNGGCAVEAQIIEEGMTATKPADPTRRGYVFAGWYSDEALTAAYDFSSPVTGDITLYAAWKRTFRSIVFDINCDDVVTNVPEIQDVVPGECAEIPAEPSRDGYLFAGWFETSSANDWTDSFAFDTPIYEDLTLYAAWVDIASDDDQDGLSDDLEDYMGTSTELDDSDTDGLNDYEDKILFDYDPTLKDTDGDGILDGDEDHDEDGLSNVWELNNGTNPILKDTDSDGLNDYDEVNTYGTDPVNRDTDGDGANDGGEIRLGTDPLTAETQFVENTSFGELTDNLQVTVDVEATVSGSQVGALKIVPVTSASNPVISPTIPGYLGYAFDISTDGQPQSAVLTFHYDTSLGTIGDDFQPRVYYYNEEAKTFEELPDQIVADGQVQVTVEHFSTYILLNKIEFDHVWEAEIKPPETENQIAKTLSIVFIIDVSGSMSGTNISTVKTVMGSFIDSMGEEDRAAIVKFASSASLVQSLTNDKTALTSAISGLYASGGTTISNGVSLGVDELVQDTAENSYDTIILLTDGQDSSFNNYWSQYAQSCVENSIIAYSIGIGSSVSSSHLTSFAEGTGGKYYHAEVADELENYFIEIKGETIDYTTDSNDDGISDYYTALIASGELPLSNGSLEFMGIDFNYNENGELSNDYDMDGIKNGDELIVKKSGERVYVFMVSDPMKVHSDADGYADNVEHQRGTDPMIYTYEDSSVDYPWNDDNFTYVGVFNEEDEWWNEGARQIWSSITFNWSHQDESKRLLASFFDTFSNVSQIEDMTDKVALEVADLMGDDLIGQAVKAYKNGNLTVDAFKEIRTAIKRWQAAGNSAKNLSPDHITQFKAQLGLFNYKYTFKGFSKADKIGMGVSFLIDEANDIYNWIQAYASITATQAAFEENRDILERIKANDDAKEKFVTRAAEDILLVINDEYSSFKVEQAKDLALATTENVAELALTMLSKANPYVLAVQLAIGLLDMLTPATEIAEATYCLYVIDELVLASKDLFTYESKTDDYYDIEETNTRHIELLICARMWGGEFAKTITGNQHYWGLFNDDEIRQEYADCIDYDNSRLAEYLKDFVR